MLKSSMLTPVAPTQVVTSASTDVASVDVNPLVIDATGAPIAVDALVEVAG